MITVVKIVEQSPETQAISDKIETGSSIVRKLFLYKSIQWLRSDELVVNSGHFLQREFTSGW